MELIGHVRNGPDIVFFAAKYPDGSDIALFLGYTLGWLQINYMDPETWIMF